jgi:NADH dehydrogenase/NADH:ubiquinone oxidoreductase subunit G
VVYVGTHRRATAQLAALVLPGAMWAEKAGVFANRQGRLQAFAQAVARPGNAREDWRVLADLLPRGGLMSRDNQTPPTSLRVLRQATAAQLALNVDLDRLPADGALPGGES